MKLNILIEEKYPYYLFFYKDLKYPDMVIDVTEEELEWIEKVVCDMDKLDKFIEEKYESL